MTTDPDDFLMGGGPPADDGPAPGPWFSAAYPGGCGWCGEPFGPGDTIRADGSGGWESQGCCHDEEDH